MLWAGEGHLAQSRILILCPAIAQPLPRECKTTSRGPGFVPPRALYQIRPLRVTGRTSSGPFVQLDAQPSPYSGDMGPSRRYQPMAERGNTARSASRWSLAFDRGVYDWNRVVGVGRGWTGTSDLPHRVALEGRPGPELRGRQRARIKPCRFAVGHWFVLGWATCEGAVAE